MITDEQRIINARNKFDGLKVELKVAEKELQNLKKQLKDEFDITNLKNGDDYIAQLQYDLQELQEKREKKMKIIESKLAKFRR